MVGIEKLSESESESESQEVGLPLGGIALSGVSMPRRPMGTSPSWEPAIGTYIGQSWPPTSEARKWENAPKPEVTADTFARLFGAGSPWTADFYPIVILAEFVEKNAGRWDTIDLPGSGANLDNELEELVKLMEYRPGVVLEALAQCNGILEYFRGVFSFTSRSHRLTYALGTAAIHIGEFQVMHYKARFNRPRPSRLSPKLMPLIEVPGHASFPSGHATQSRLVATLLAKVMPPQAEAPLSCLADRIARNREVMGLHYSSDTKAGKWLADKTFELLFRCDTVRKMIEEGRKEWDLQPLASGELVRPLHNLR